MRRMTRVPSASLGRATGPALLASAGAMAFLAAWGGIASVRAQSGPIITDPTQLISGSGVPPASLRFVNPPAATPTAGPTFTTTTTRAVMQVNAEQLVYDERADRVIARGKVQIYYDGRTIEADQVTYDRGANRVRAVGNVRVTEPSGNIAHAQELDFDQNFRNGFVRSLNIETPDRRYIGAATVTRENGETTTFERAVYTACASCADGSRPPTWQIKSKRIIHKESERTIFFEESRFELFGQPISYLPRFWTPDPTVRKASGFLVSNVTATSRLGVAVEVPYFWNIAPDMDLLFTARYYSRQGFMPVAEFRKGFESGGFAIRAAGISQQDISAFTINGEPEVGARRLRGVVQSVGEFRINENWRFGWDVNLMTDSAFLRDYSLMLPGQTEANSRVYLRGQGERSWFDLSATRYVGISPTDFTNRVLPSTHPVIDYFRVYDKSVFGGEFSWRANITSMSRETADVNSRYTPGSQVTCDVSKPRSATNLNPSNCIVNGIDGSYTRASAELAWRRRIIDASGQVWEPFFSVRGDLAGYQMRDQGEVLGSFEGLNNDNRLYGRFMPTAGLTYRYPFVSANQYGATTFEPIVQVIARPNEELIGKLPNEDSQSLVFDDTNLFSVNKFSGWDRVEGGGRLNYGAVMTHRFLNGSNVNVLFGQSITLFGKNSYEYGSNTATQNASGTYDATGTGANSGLDKPRSDYVGRINYIINSQFRFSARGRFDERNLNIQRGELEAAGRFGRIGLTATFAHYAPQPDLGYQVARTGVAAAATLHVNDVWSLYLASRYAFQRQKVLPEDATNLTLEQLIERNKIEGFTIGVNYLDDSMQFGVFYSRDFAAAVVLNASNVYETRDVHRFMFRFNLRTLGETAVSQNPTSWFTQSSR